VTTALTLAAVLRAAHGDRTWNGTVDEALLADARRHGVGPLLYRAARGSAAWEHQTDAVRHALQQLAAEAILVDHARLTGDRRVIAGLAAAGLEPLIFKGAALAHSHYAESWLRTRVDTDLLIRPHARESASRVCERLGCVRIARPVGEHVTHQFTWVTCVHGVRLEYDIHWKIADPEVFANVLTYDELADDAVPVPALGPGARAIGDIHALLVACTHRVAHHFDREWILFLSDIDRLARRVDAVGWQRVVALAKQRGILAVCARGLTLAAERLGTPVPRDVLEGLTATDDEPTAAYLDHHLRRYDILRSDLRALGNWRARARLVREHLLPPADYMLASYGTTRASLLPALYIHRVVRGAREWFRPFKSP
jgi:putative nucleotidyltransferase-like protein